MQSVSSSASLKEAILQLENRQKIEKELLIESLEVVREELKPVNLVKDTFSRLLKSPRLLPAILMVSAGLTIAFVVSKKFSETKSSLIKKIIGKLMLNATKGFFSELF